MGFEPDARLVLTEGVDLRSLPLTPTDFFLFSRIDSLRGSKPTVAEVISASGQPAEMASAAIARLIELGVVRLEASERAKDQAPRERTASGRMRPLTMGEQTRTRARNRKRDLLESQMRAFRPKESPSVKPEGPTPEPEAPLPVSRPVGVPSAGGARSILDEVEPVATTDPRLVQDSSVDLDRQRRLLALRDRLRHVGHFELLGLHPVDDSKQIRRAYHVVSREFHPDSFYGKNLGGFRDVLDDLFRRARASYEFLLDPARRKPLVDAHEAKLQAERDVMEREQAESQRQLDQLQTKLEAEAAAKERVAREAREERDRERQARIRGRAVDQRRKQAIKHADQARRELNQGRHGTAATLFRLAHEQDPKNSEYEQAWRESLQVARQQRALKSFEHALAARADGRGHEAARHFASAADADPTLRHLGEAAGAMAPIDAERARKYAMAALEALSQAKSRGLPLEDRVIADIHEACARAFLSAGQLASASEQAKLAHELGPSKQRRTLLNSIKLT